MTMADQQRPSDLQAVHTVPCQSEVGDEAETSGRAAEFYVMVASEFYYIKITLNYNKLNEEFLAYEEFPSQDHQ